MKKVFLIRWFSDDIVWKAFSREEDARKFADFVNSHTTTNELEVWVDSVSLD